MMTLTIRAIMIFRELNSAFSDSKVVNTPGPAINGKITGTSVAVPPGLSNLKISIPKVISMATTNMTNDPAIANEDTSTPKRLSIPSPAKKKIIMISREKMAAFSGL